MCGNTTDTGVNLNTHLRYILLMVGEGGVGRGREGNGGRDGEKREEV